MNTKPHLAQFKHYISSPVQPLFIWTQEILDLGTQFPLVNPKNGKVCFVFSMSYSQTEDFIERALTLKTNIAEKLLVKISDIHSSVCSGNDYDEVVLNFFIDHKHISPIFWHSYSVEEQNDFLLTQKIKDLAACFKRMPELQKSILKKLAVYNFSFTEEEYQSIILNQGGGIWDLLMKLATKSPYVWNGQTYDNASLITAILQS